MCTGFSKLVSKFLQGFYQPATSTHDKLTNHEGADNGGVVFYDEGAEEDDEGNKVDKDEDQSTDPEWHGETEREAEDNRCLVYSEPINRRANLKRKSMLGKNLSLPIDVSSSGDDYSHESAGTQKSRKKNQQLDVKLAKNSGHASISEMDNPLFTPCKSPKAKGHSTPQNESIANSAGETMDSQEILPEMMDSRGHLNTHVCDASAGDAHDMLYSPELRKKMASAHKNSSDQSTLYINRAIAEKEQKLASLCQEAQKIANDKEREQEALRIFQSELSRAKEGYDDIQ
ncbi:unnamed protein product [Urochloa humidicola]